MDLADIKGPGVINHIWITVADQTEKDYYVLRDLVLRMYWDDEETPSVESPLGDFFCCGFARDCIVNSLPICVVPARGFNCYFQMPFGKRARITLENQHETVAQGEADAAAEGLYDPGWCEGTRALCRHVYCPYLTGALLVWRR